MNTRKHKHLSPNEEPFQAKSRKQGGKTEHFTKSEIKKGSKKERKANIKKDRKKEWNLY